MLSNFNDFSDFSCKAGDKSQKTSKVAECSSDSGSEHSIAKASGLMARKHRAATGVPQVYRSFIKCRHLQDMIISAGLILRSCSYTCILSASTAQFVSGRAYAPPFWRVDVTKDCVQ